MARYAPALVQTRLQAIADAIDAGPAAPILKVLDPNGVVMGQITLAKPCGTVSSGTLVFEGFPKTVGMSVSGEPVQAQILDGNGAVVVDQITIGTSPDSTIQIANQYVQNGQGITIFALWDQHS